MTGAGGAGAAQDYARGARASQIQSRRPKRLGAFRQHADDERGIEILPVPAAWWCTKCGYLVTPADREDPDATRGDPMRRDPIGTAFDRPCPHCRERSWIDLGVVPHALRVRDEETALQYRKHARRARSIASMVVMVAGLLLGATVDMVIAWVLMPVGLVALALFGTPVQSSMDAWRTGHADPPPPVRRWHRPVGAWLRGARLARGTAQGRNTTAPLSGWPAIAWVVAICEGDDDPRQTKHWNNDAGWLLVEQHCEGLTIDDRALEREPVVLVSLRPAIAASPAAQQWLRTRGFEPSDDVRLFEGIIMAGEMVELRANRLGRVPICTTLR